MQNNSPTVIIQLVFNVGLFSYWQNKNKITIIYVTATYMTMNSCSLLCIYFLFTINTCFTKSSSIVMY